MQRAWQKVAAHQRLFSARRTTVDFLARRPAREDLRSINAEAAVPLPAYGFADREKLRYVLALRRVGEATLLRDSDRVPKLMNLHRDDIPL